MTTFIVVLVIIAVLFLGYVYLITLPQRRRHKKHTQELTNAGIEISFLPQENYGPFEQEKEYPRQPKTLLSMGGRYDNVLQGPTSLGKAWVFEYAYETGSGDTLSSYSQTVAAFSLTTISLPNFSLKPAKILRKLVPISLLEKANQALMNEEIIFEDYPVFSRTYQLNGLDEPALQSLFRHDMLEYWEKLAAKEKWAADGSGHWLIVYRDNTIVPPGELRNFLSKAEEIARQFQSNALPTAD